MELAAQYARALFETQKPDIKNLRAALEKRGHTKLMPRIFTEYEKLVLAKERREQALNVTPEAERTRILLELYHKLVGTN